jgi:peroxiredoxin
LAAKLSNDTTVTDANKRQQLAAMDKKTTDEYVAMSFNLAQKHINTAVGTNIFLNAHNYLSPEQNDALYALMNEATKANPNIAQSIATNAVRKSVAVGKQFVDIKGINPQGDSISLSQFIGKTDYVLLDFWASWCIWCVRSFPDLKELYSKYGGKELEIVGFSIDDTIEDWTRGIQKNQITWQQMSDLTGRSNNSAHKYAVYGIPSTFLIDKTGKIVAHNADIADIECIISGKK